MKKILSLMMLLVAIVTGARAADPVVKTYTFDDGVALDTDWNIEKTIPSGGSAVCEITNKLSGASFSVKDKNYLGLAYLNKGNVGITLTTTASYSNISKISIDAVAGDNSKPTFAAYIVTEDGDQVVFSAVGSKEGFSTGGKNKWGNKTVSFETPLSGKLKIVTTASSSGKYAAIDNIAITYTETPSGPVDPVFSLSATSIGTDKTAQIKVAGKDDLDGITLSDIDYGTSGVVTVSSAGVVTPVATGTTTITFSSAAVDGKYNAGSVTSDNPLTITVTAPVVVTPTLTAGGYFFDDSKTVEIACTDADATIKYSYDNSTWNDYTTALTITETTTVYAKAVKTGCEDSEVASATYTKFAPSKIAEVSTATTWDWTSWDQELQLTDTSTPTSTDNYTYADIAVLNGNITVPASFAGDKIMFKGQYPVRSNKSQAGTWTIKPSVAGTIKVTFSDTGVKVPTGGAAKRYLNINGVNTEYYTQRDGSTADEKTTDEIVVPAGDVVITAYGEDGETWQAIVVKKIVFTPATATTINLNASGFATYSKETDFMFAGATGYKMTLDEDAKTITGKKVTGKIKAGEGILFKGDAGATVTIVETTGATALEGNSLKGTTTASGKATVPTYCYTLSGNTFKKFTGAAFNDNKAYFEASQDLKGQSFEIIFDGEATAINIVVEDDANVAAAPVKTIKNGQLYIGNYNVAGARIK